jgi:YfiH family protein
MAAVLLAERDIVRPAWPAPAHVGAFMSTRGGGVSCGDWASLNLGRSVGDSAECVAENRRRFVASLRSPRAGVARPVWLRQVHGTQVLEVDESTAEHPEPPADAAWTRTAGIACIVGAADCLPVLFATRDGRAVAAAHAGWRGLAGGVLEATVSALGRGAAVEPAELLAWLGPCIGARRFEVGADVLRAFGVPPEAAGAEHFRYAPRADGAARWLADLHGLARVRLRALGVGFIAADASCTHEEASRFFSFRRSGGTPSGRMAAAIWIGSPSARVG